MWWFLASIIGGVVLAIGLGFLIKKFRNGTGFFFRSVKTRFSDYERDIESNKKFSKSVWELKHVMAKEVMVPRSEIICIASGKSLIQALNLAIKSGHSRLPVIGSSIDEILGVVYLKDIAAELLVVNQHREFNAKNNTKINSIIKPAVFVPDTKDLATALDQMQSEKNHLMILINEYGGVAGLITIEDVLEEIVGEIQDEYDEQEIESIVKLSPDKYRIMAWLPLSEFDKFFNTDFSKETGLETVSGLFAYFLGRVPLPGAKITLASLKLEAEGKFDKRSRVKIVTILVTKLFKNEVRQNE